MAHMKGQMIDDSIMDVTVLPTEAYQYCDFDTAVRMAREVRHIYPEIFIAAVSFRRESATNWVACDE